MPSDTEIVNVGLRMVGSTRITSLSDGTKPANAANDIYDPLRKSMLSYPWNFAASRAKLARSATTPEYEFNYAYVLPSDWLYTVSVHDNDAGASSIYFKEEQVAGQNVLLSSEEDVYLRYTKDETDPNLWSVNFRRAMSTALGRDFAIPLANSNKLFQLLTIQARRDLNKAQGTDSLGSFPERRPRGSWANSRSGGFHGLHGYGR